MLDATRRFTLPRLTVILLLLFLSICLVSCRNESEDSSSPSTSSSESTAAPTILTNVFSSESLALSEDWIPSSLAAPLYDESADTYTYVAAKREELESEDGMITAMQTLALVTADEDGTVSLVKTLDLPPELYQIDGAPEKTRQPVCGVLTEDSFFVAFYSFFFGETTTLLVKIDLSTMEMTRSEVLTGYFPTGESSNNLKHPGFILLLDKDGNLYMSNYAEVAIFSPSLSPVASFGKENAENALQSLVLGADGKVWLSAYRADTLCFGISPIGPDGSLGKQLVYGDGTSSYVLVSAASYEPYDFYWMDETTGLFGASIGEGGELTAEQQFDFLNSNIARNRNTLGRLEGDETYPLLILDQNRIVFFANDASSSGQSVSLRVYHRREDIDLSSMPHLLIAYDNALDTDIFERVMDFRKANPDVYLSLADYSVYTTDESIFGGTERLLFDISTKTIQPDILFISTGLEQAAEYVRSEKLAVDLMPYLETDEKVNRSTLFGSALHLFDDGEGGIWGLPLRIQMRTLASTAEALGPYAEKKSWTLEEFLSFAEDKKKLDPNFTRSNPAQYLAEGFGMFVDWDTGTCSFDDELFIRYINFLASLPERAPSIEERSAINWGEVSLRGYSLFNPGIVFNALTLFEEKPVYIGYATKGTSGASIDCMNTLLITKFAKEPDLCWKLLTSFFDDAALDPLNAVTSSTKLGISSLRGPLESFFDNALENADLVVPDIDNSLLLLISKGSASAQQKTIPFTREDCDNILAVLDEGGAPLFQRLPSEAEQIIEEELSSFFAGVGSAEDCAKKVQSRIGIWLAERR